MRIKFNLPDLVLENIRQYVGNCRLHNGELIRTIDKSSQVIRRLEIKLHNRKINTYCNSYKPLFTKIEDFEGPLPNLEEHVPISYPEGPPTPKPENFTLRAFWPEDRCGNRFRSISYIYQAESDTLTFQYKAKKKKSCIDVEIEIK